MTRIDLLFFLAIILFLRGINGSEFLYDSIESTPAINNTENPWLSSSTTAQTIATTLTPYTTDIDKVTTTTLGPNVPATTIVEPVTNTFIVTNELIVNFSLNFTTINLKTGESDSRNETITFVKSQVLDTFAQTLDVNSKYITISLSKYQIYTFSKRLNTTNTTITTNSLKLGSLQSQSELENSNIVSYNGYLCHVCARIAAASHRNAEEYEATLETDPDTPQDSRFVTKLQNKLNAQSIDLSIFYFDITTFASNKGTEDSNKTTTIIVWFLGASVVCCIVALIIIVGWRRISQEKATKAEGINLEFLLDPNAPIGDSNFLNSLDAPMKIPKHYGNNFSLNNHGINSSMDASGVIYSGTIADAAAKIGQEDGNFNTIRQSPGFKTKPKAKNKNKIRKPKQAYFDRLGDENNDDTIQAPLRKASENELQSTATRVSLSMSMSMSNDNIKNDAKNENDRGKRKTSYDFEDDHNIDDSDEEDAYMMAHSSSDDAPVSQFDRM